MALVPKICLNERVGSFTIKNVTGLYSFDYPYGFGPLTVIPGAAAGWVTSCTAYVTDPMGTTVTIDLGIDFSENESEFQVMPWDLSQGGKEIMSGKWTVKFVIEGTKPTGEVFCYSGTAVDIFYKAVECCLDKKTAATPMVNMNDVFRNEPSRQVALMQALFNRFLRADCCGDMVNSNNIITYLRLHCRCGC